MPGLLACSWARNKTEHAQELFERARDAYTCLKGLPCNAEIREADFRVARFASEVSLSRHIPYARHEVHDSCRGMVV